MLVSANHSWAGKGLSQPRMDSWDIRDPFIKRERNRHGEAASNGHEIYPRLKTYCALRTVCLMQTLSLELLDWKWALQMFYPCDSSPSQDSILKGAFRIFGGNVTVPHPTKGIGRFLKIGEHCPVSWWMTLQDSYVAVLAWWSRIWTSEVRPFGGWRTLPVRCIGFPYPPQASPL